MVRGVGGPGANRSRASRRGDAWVGEHRAIDVRVSRLFEAEPARPAAGRRRPVSLRAACRGALPAPGDQNVPPAGGRAAGPCVPGARPGALATSEGCSAGASPPPSCRVNCKESLPALQSVKGPCARTGGQDLGLTRLR